MNLWILIPGIQRWIWCRFWSSVFCSSPERRTFVTGGLGVASGGTGTLLSRTSPPDMQFHGYYCLRKDRNSYFMIAVQLLSRVWLFVTPWTTAHQASLPFSVSRSLLKLMSMESVMPSNHLILYHPLLLLPSVFHSIRVFSSESALHIRWPKYWSFSISPSSDYLGLISFRVD